MFIVDSTFDKHRLGTLDKFLDEEYSILCPVKIRMKSVGNYMLIFDCLEGEVSKKRWVEAVQDGEGRLIGYFGLTMNLKVLVENSLSFFLFSFEPGIGMMYQDDLDSKDLSDSAKLSLSRLSRG